jgi:nucleoporin NDC1
MILLFIPALIVIILRVAQWHVGHRNTHTLSETFFKYALRKGTFMTLAGYIISAFFYSEVYIWTRSEKSRLSFTDRGGREHDWIRLNERALYIRYMFVSIGIGQALVHLWYDYDKIEVPAVRPRSDRDAQDAISPVPLWKQLWQKMKPMTTTAASLTFITTFVATFLYFKAFRSYLWDIYYLLARYIVSLRKTSSPFGLPPFAPLLGMFLTQGTLLVLLWQFANKAFDISISREPIKEEKHLNRDRPITSDSKDPNGSLLNGLKAKKDTVKAIALWELALISERYPERRKTIFGELDRKTAATFKQVTDICLSEIRLLTSRLNIALDPRYQPDDAQGQKKTSGTITLVPRIAQPPKEALIKGEGPERDARAEISAFTSGIAKNLSSPENSKSAYAREGIRKSEEVAIAGANAVMTKTAGWWPSIVASWLGLPFRQDLRRSVSFIIGGAPYSRISVLCNSITAISNLAVSSLREDDYGSVSKQIPEIIRVLITALKKLEEYVDSLTVHWTDFKRLAMPEEERMRVPEIELVRDCLRDGLGNILRTFGEYLPAMGLDKSEIQEARRLAGRGPEMAFVR